MHDGGYAVLGEVRGRFTEGFRAGMDFELVVGATNKDTALFLLHDASDKDEAIPAQVVKVDLGALAVKMIEIVRSDQGALDKENPYLKFVGYDLTDGQVVYKALSKGVIERAELTSRHITILIGKSIGFEQRLITIHGQPLPGMTRAVLVCDARKGMPLLRLETILLSRKRSETLHNQQSVQELSTF